MNKNFNSSKICFQTVNVVVKSELKLKLFIHNETILNEKAKNTEMKYKFFLKENSNCCAKLHDKVLLQESQF